MSIKLYNLEQKEDGTVTVQTDLSPEDMLTLLTIGFYACMERGVMVKSLAGFFQAPEAQMEGTTIEGEVQTVNYNDYLDVGIIEGENKKNA